MCHDFSLLRIRMTRVRVACDELFFLCFYLFGLLYLRDSKTSESCRGDFPQCQSQHPARFIVLQRRQHALKGVARQGIDHGSACLCMCTAGTSSKATHM